MKNSDLDTKNAEPPADRLEPVLALMETDPDGALSALGNLIDQYPADARLHFMLGSLLAGLERYPEAHTAMQKAVDLAPGYALARFQLGFLALTSGDAAGARSVWQPLLDLPSEDSLNLFVRGLDAMSADHFDEAIGLLEAGIARNERVAPLNRNMALLVHEMRARLNPRHTEDKAVESDAHFLLKQYSFKDTRH